MDEGYFTVESSEVEQEKGIRGRGAVGKQNVAVMAESTPLEDMETGKKSRQVRYFKAKVLEDHKAEGINEMIKKSIEIKLAHGLEARPVAELVQLASKYDSTVHIEAQSKKVNAKSIMGMMTLNLNSGEKIDVIADGKDEEAVVADMESYLQGVKH